ncbi:MAG: hypothetical protein OXF61_12480 [Acidimicrobiaceae bacterium]|nr:hypothetical protein [Acidimicrobiaceae bacterium]
MQSGGRTGSLLHRLRDALAASPAVILQGARFIGKTTLARHLSASALSCR